MLILWTAAALAAGPVTEGAVVYRTVDDGVSIDSTVTFKDGLVHSRVEQRGGAQLWVDATAGTLWLKVSGTPAIQSDLVAVHEEDAFVQPLGEQRMVQGYPCDGYRAELLFEDGRSARMTVWSTPLLDPGFDSLVLGGAPFGLPGVSGMPLATEVVMFTPEGEQRQSSEAVSIDLSRVEPSKVAAPAKVRAEGATLQR